MSITFLAELSHVEKAADTIVAARKVGSSERLAVEDYCVAHGLSSMSDMFCLAIGFVERKKIHKRMQR